MYTESLVAITPADFRDTAEQLGMAMGHSGHEFSVPLYTGETLTHYGLHAWVTPEAAAVWLGNAYPPDTGYTDEQIDAIRTALIVSVQTGGVPAEHFGAVLEAEGLSMEMETVE
jgi:hypothetical protein